MNCEECVNESFYNEIIKEIKKQTGFRKKEKICEYAQRKWLMPCICPLIN